MKEMFARSYFPTSFGNAWTKAKDRAQKMLQAFFHGRLADSVIDPIYSEASTLRSRKWALRPKRASGRGVTSPCSGAELTTSQAARSDEVSNAHLEASSAVHHSTGRPPSRRTSRTGGWEPVSGPKEITSA